MIDDQTRNNYIGQFIKDFRSSRGLSLDDLSKHSGVSRSMICQIEGEQTNPTLSVLAKLAGAMDIKLSELVDPTVPSTLYRHQCLKDAKSKTLSSDGSYICSLLTEGSANRHIEVFAFQFSKRGKFQSKGHGPRAVEYLFLTEGEMTLELDKQNLKIAEGDLVEFRAANQHHYIQESKRLAKGLSLVFYGV